MSLSQAAQQSEPTVEGDADEGDWSPDFEPDADDWTQRPPWNVFDIVDAYMIGQSPVRESTPVNESITSGQ